MTEIRMIGNWLTRKPQEGAYTITALMAIVLWGLSIFYISRNVSWLAATPHSVFVDHQYWRLWTTLFAHADIAHLLSNWLLFLPLAYLLNGYFGSLFFPLLGFFWGGVINIFVLKSLPLETTLVGISGVVYWMGAAWLTLYYLIDKRRTPVKRFAVALGIALVIFAPETYKPEVSYLSHFLGFVTGSASALIYYLFQRAKFAAAERFQVIVEEPEDDASQLPPEVVESLPHWQ